jgi:hypothetical protein
MPTLAMQVARPRAFMVAVLPPVLGPAAAAAAAAEEHNDASGMCSSEKNVCRYSLKTVVPSAKNTLSPPLYIPPACWAFAKHSHL